jgi:hypothetical protein
MENKKIRVNQERINQIRQALGSGGRLEIPEELKKEGYYYYWASDEKPYRLSQLEKLGYSPVKHKNGKALKIYGGTTERGMEYHLCAMEIHKDKKEEIDFVKRADKAAARDNKMASAFSNLNPNETYTKEGMGDLSTLSNIQNNIKKL